MIASARFFRSSRGSIVTIYKYFKMAKSDYLQLNSLLRSLIAILVILPTILVDHVLDPLSPWSILLPTLTLLILFIFALIIVNLYKHRNETDR
jgi:hypothetical protein